MKVLFLSDLHLGAGYIDYPRSYEKRICDFLTEHGKGCDQIYLLGDILDYWFEYRNVVPRGYIRFFGVLASLTDSGVKVTWLTGNHDIWLFDYLQSELGIEVVDAPYLLRHIGDKNFMLAHGDRVMRGSAGFRFISKTFRNKICQKLFAAVHPRWTIPFAHRWSNSSREAHSNSKTSEIRSQVIADELRLILKSEPLPDFIILGHYHFITDENLNPAGPRLIVLGDWIDNPSYAVFDGTQLTLHKL